MEKYDIVITSHEKDFNKIKYVVESAEKFLTGFDNIYLILSERVEYNELDILKTKTSRPIHLYKETDVLNVDKTKISHRPNWIYQMLLKMFQTITINDNFLILESDSIFNTKINFFEDNKIIFYLGNDQYHIPYFEFSKKIANIGREYNHTFICEFMMYNKKKIIELLKISKCNDVYEFIEKTYQYVTPSCYPADYELYGNFMYKYYKDELILKPIKVLLNATHSIWTDSSIESLIRNTSGDVISFHTWGFN